MCVDYVYSDNKGFDLSTRKKNLREPTELFLEHFLNDNATKTRVNTTTGGSI